jgi:peptidyl-prolyl cis-trans isomerase C
MPRKETELITVQKPLAVRLARVCALALIPVGFALTAAPAAAQNAAVVNNKPIPKERVDEFVAMLVSQGRPDTPELRAAVREELIAREIFSQEAERKGLGKNIEVQRQLESVRQDILIRAMIREHLKENPVTDADVEAEYKKLTGENAQKEYRARHILVDDEAQARALVEELKKGASFEELAKKSKDTGSAQQGGDLDWNTADTFVKEFSDAMVALQKGKFTEVPVKSQFGWHVIRLDDVRDAAPPPMDQVKPQIRQEIERARIQKLQQDLRAKAKVQ